MRHAASQQNRQQVELYRKMIRAIGERRRKRHPHAPHKVAHIACRLAIIRAGQPALPVRGERLRTIAGKPVERFDGRCRSGKPASEVKRGKRPYVLPARRCKQSVHLADRKEVLQRTRQAHTASWRLVFAQLCSPLEQAPRRIEEIGPGYTLRQCVPRIAINRREAL